MGLDLGTGLRQVVVVAPEPIHPAHGCWALTTLQPNGPLGSSQSTVRVRLIAISVAPGARVAHMGVENPNSDTQVQRIPLIWHADT